MKKKDVQIKRCDISGMVHSEININKIKSKKDVKD